jgi:hypothetical protein
MRRALALVLPALVVIVIATDGFARTTRANVRGVCSTPSSLKFHGRACALVELTG